MPRPRRTLHRTKRPATEVCPGYRKYPIAETRGGLGFEQTWWGQCMDCGFWFRMTQRTGTFLRQHRRDVPTERNPQ
jgi:hypothetical protein